MTKLKHVKEGSHQTEDMPFHVVHTVKVLLSSEETTQVVVRHHAQHRRKELHGAAGVLGTRTAAVAVGESRTVQAILSKYDDERTVRQRARIRVAILRAKPSVVWTQRAQPLFHNRTMTE